MPSGGAWAKGTGALTSARTIIALAAFGLVVLASQSAYAFELFGMKFFESESEQDADSVIADPQPYKVTVSVASGDGDIESLVRSASTLAKGESEPASGAAGLLASARGDYRRILAALYQDGRYGGTVNIQVGGQEASNLPPDTKLPKPAAVSIIVDAGPLFHFGRVDIVNPAPPTNDPWDQVDAPSSEGYGTGEVARSNVILKAEELAMSAWRQQGYAKASIADRQVVADHQTNLVDVVIQVDPGPHASVGPVGVQGTQNMNPDFVARQTGLMPGAEYDPDDIAKAEKRLNRLDVFRSMRVEAADRVQNDGLLPFTVIVQEQPLRRFGIGATIASIDGLGVEGFWMHRNLFGQAERLRLDAKIAGIGYELDTKEFDYAFGGTFTKPGFLTPDTDFVAAISAERTVLDTYTETSILGSVGLTHMLSDEITLDGAAIAEKAEFVDDFGTRTFTTAGLQLGATLDNRDSTTDPTEGFYVRGVLEPMYELEYGNTAIRTTVEARTYFGFGEDDPFVLAGRVKGGALLGPSLEEIPPDRLFFAGGGGSVRGYGFKSIGVERFDGVTTGGRYLLEGSLEARARFGDFGAVAFVDGGYVAADSFPSLDELRLGAGVGLRYYTGFGPLRLDAAIPLNKRAGDPDYALYVGIGQAF